MLARKTLYQTCWLKWTLFAVFLTSQLTAFSQYTAPDPAQLAKLFQSPPPAASPWVFWYWMQASVSREGITADLEAMKQDGIGGAYLMPIKGATNPPLLEPPTEQLSPRWWDMVRFALGEADRLGLKLAMHVSDGFALAGGPWITPEMSMQKLVWTKTTTDGGRPFSDTLQHPQSYMGYYQDIAVLAFPSLPGAGITTHTVRPIVTTNKINIDPQFLAEEGNKQNFTSDEPCWIQYAFDQPFTCRSITVKTDGRNYQAYRLAIEVSNDGKTFHAAGRLEPPRAGWQDNDVDVTHSIKTVTARFFRFLYNKEGSEPGAEDLDAAKWKQNLKTNGIELSSEPCLHQYEGKNGEIWRISRRTNTDQISVNLCISKNKIIDITRYLDTNGRLNWHIPPGRWTILRIGHTSTGHMNETAGGGKGLECDKFSPEAVTTQFDHWFAEVFRKAGPVASRVLKVFHVDSWECGSQNWSPVFREEFQRRRGYDLYTYLPAMAGIPVESADVSERFLYDVRQTIAELIADKFYGTLKALAHAKGCTISAESVAPTMVSDGMLHYDASDVPMGEFWFRSPTHDKPNDVLDAISGAHIYGKPVIQAEAFTELRMAWDEYPGMLKTLADRNFALGFNRYVFHVFVHNPWMDRKPGMTLDGVGLYFQRDQTWWKPGRAWVDYISRCQTLLQVGRPVVDIAVFTGEEIPRRAILPDRLVSTLPGIFGEKVVKSEQIRLSNKNSPVRESPAGVYSSANMADPENWIDPLRGYAYDSFNEDALLRLAKVENGRIVLPGGASYGMLVIPQATQMMPNNRLMKEEVSARLLDLVKEGATLLVGDKPQHSPSLHNFPGGDEKSNQNNQQLWPVKPGKSVPQRRGKGRVMQLPYRSGSFNPLGIEQDIIATDATNRQTEGITWTHRTAPGIDIYFMSNQQHKQRDLNISLRVHGKTPELWDAVTGETRVAGEWKIQGGRTLLPVRLEPDGSVFVVFRQPTQKKQTNQGKNWTMTDTVQFIEGNWQVVFDRAAGGPEKAVFWDELKDWSKQTDTGMRYYSGTVVYTKNFDWEDNPENRAVYLDMGEVANIASVRINNVDCGVAWTIPYRIDISKALKRGTNKIRIEVTNTWANRLTGDHRLPENRRLTNTVAPYRLDGKPLLPAGLLGPVMILRSLKSRE